MPLAAGDTLGAYQILAPLGAGGMGEVYRARDSKLERDVAIKVLPEAFASDAERAARFEREAKALAALNHPHIAQIHGLDDTGGRLALVMELVEGPTLAERLARGPLPVGEALDVARQIGEALSAAHEAGIVHRDLKPANVKLRPDGTVKVLDFGLAKVLAPADPLSPEGSHAPTLTSPAGTQAGIILGTAAYMSPEQARGRAVDRRTDVWALGCVLFEMLTAKRAFEAEDVSLTLSKVLQVEPDWDALPADVPPPVERTLRVCLKKDWRERAADVHDVQLALEGAFDPGSARPREATRSRLLPLAGALVLGGLLVGVADRLARPPDEPHGVTRFTVPLPEDETLRSTHRQLLAISRDGRQVVVNTSAGLVVRRMDTLESAIVPVTGSITSPFFSPDGRSLGYWEATPGQLKRRSLDGGAAVVIAAVTECYEATWEEDDTILFAQSGGIYRVAASGGTPERLVAAGEGERLTDPQLLPGGEAVLFTATATATERTQVVAQSLTTGDRTVVVENAADARPLPTGHLLYAVEDGLFAVAFDAEALVVHGAPVSVIESVRSYPGLASLQYDVSSGGTLAYLTGEPETRALVWVDREGREEALAAPPRAYASPALSPDGTRVALDVRDPQSDVLIWDLARGTPRRLTFEPGPDRVPTWSPDGGRIAYSSTRDGGLGDLYWQPADGTGTAELLLRVPNAAFPHSFSPDGRQLLFMVDRGGTGTGLDIEMVSTDGDHTVTRLIQTPANEQNAQPSPDGRWLAYQSNESGEYEVYVQPFPGPGGGRWLVSTNGGTRPLWSRDGRELFYMETPGRLLAVPILPGTSFEFGSPELVVEGPYVAPYSGPSYDVSLDGQRFLMMKNAGQAGNSTVVVVEDWFEELRERVPR